MDTFVVNCNALNYMLELEDRVEKHNELIYDRYLVV